MYAYDAWNRLVRAVNAEDTSVTIHEAEFDGRGRRIKKVVTNAGPDNGTVVFYYNGWKMIETRDGSGNLYQQFIHGTQYIDEIVMTRIADQGEYYVHQDANWNVIALTDMGGNVLERYEYTPYGQFTAHQVTGFGDRDGDGDVDATDKGTPGTTCSGTVTGACRILDLDFDGDYDSADATLFDALPQGLARHPGLLTTALDFPFAHQGLYYDPELGSYQNRHRQYDPKLRRFMQRDPLALNAFGAAGYQDGLSLYAYVGGGPMSRLDPLGKDTVDLPGILRRARDWGCGMTIELCTSVPLSIPNTYGPAFSHCLSHCLIAKYCGVQASEDIGITTERAQVYMCYLMPFLQGECRSADQQSDYYDNELGRQQAKKGGSCYSNCKGAMGGQTHHPEGPGTDRPYGPHTQDPDVPGPKADPKAPMPPGWGPPNAGPIWHPPDPRTR